MKDITRFHLEKLKRDMATGGQPQRSIAYALSFGRQVFNVAKRLGVFAGENPTTKVKFPKPDKGRMRFLTHNDAVRLLEALAGRTGCEFYGIKTSCEILFLVYKIDRGDLCRNTRKSAILKPLN